VEVAALAAGVAAAVKAAAAPAACQAVAYTHPQGCRNQPGNRRVPWRSILKSAHLLEVWGRPGLPLPLTV
jgi:hypothetical protein